MNNPRLFVKNLDNIEYKICSYLMRNRILNASIICSSEQIMDQLAEYMYLCRIPYSYINDRYRKLSGYRLSVFSDTKTELSYQFIKISYHINETSCRESKTQEFLFHDIVDACITDYTIDLNTVPIHLQNAEIRRMFLYAFKIAKSEIDIISPWMNASVINESLLNLMEDAFDRGVKIKIIYGLKPDSSEYSISRSRRSDEMAELMLKRFSNRKGLFFIKRDNIHYKLVLCDELYKLEGGFNYLSFNGNYNDFDIRKEGSPFGRDAKEIKLLRDYYFKE